MEAKWRRELGHDNHNNTVAGHDDEAQKTKAPKWQDNHTESPHLDHNRHPANNNLEHDTFAGTDANSSERTKRKTGDTSG